MTGFIRLHTSHITPYMYMLFLVCCSLYVICCPAVHRMTWWLALTSVLLAMLALTLQDTNALRNRNTLTPLFPLEGVSVR